jgi:acetolactate synthase-1/2/3 large subunit
MSAIPKTSTQYGYENVADALVQAGVQCIFGVLGDDTGPLIDATSARGIQYIFARHENQAVAMADGYSRATGRTGVATVTGGPGFSNALTAIHSAHRARSGVCVLIGAGSLTEDDLAAHRIRSTPPANWLKFFPQTATLDLLGICSVKPDSAAGAWHDTQIAMQQARTSTVVLVLARDVLEGKVASGEAHAPIAAQTDEPVALPDPEQIETIADLLEETWAVKRPLILAGRGALMSDAGSALRRLGELTGALLTTTLHANALFHGDPHNIGICGTYSTPVASDLILQADCVLVFGAGLNALTTYKNTLFPKAMVIQVDTDASAFGRFVDVEIGVQADCRLTAQALVAELERREHQAPGFRTDSVRDSIAGYRASDEVKDKSTAQLIDPKTLMIELDRQLPPERILCSDGGQQARFAIRYIQIAQSRNFIQACDAGAIGLGIGTAIGAAVSRPEDIVLATIGDASMMMSLGDLETAVRLRLPIVVVVSNDEALGSEVNFLSEHGLSADVALTPSPSFAAIAAAMGAQAATIRSTADLSAALKPWLANTHVGPLVLDCRINPDVRAHFV